MSPFYKLWKEEVHVHLLAKVFQFTKDAKALDSVAY